MTASGEQLEVEVPHALDGERVDKAVALLADLTRSVVARLVEEGAIRLDGKPVAKVSRKLAEGELLVVDLPQVEVHELAPEADVVFEVVHEDADLVVVDKPAGLVVHPGHGTPGGTLVNGLLARYPELAEVGEEPERPGVVHRLDAGTSGLLVVARTTEAFDDLVEQLAERTVHRSYVALVHGVVAGNGGLVDAPLGRDPKVPTRRAVVQDGKEARTRYAVEERFDGHTLLGCELETGRTHQIRAHLAAIGHPVVSDPLYKGRPAFGLERPFLHARALGFVHPSTGAPLSFESPLPEDLAAALAVARA